MLSIDDTNDANANGIPDFSDDPASVTPPRAPHLSLALGSTNLLLTISGSVGHTNQIQTVGSLTSTNWANDAVFPADQRSTGGFPAVAGWNAEVLAGRGAVRSGPVAICEARRQDAGAPGFRNRYSKPCGSCPSTECGSAFGFNNAPCTIPRLGVS